MLCRDCGLNPRFENQTKCAACRECNRKRSNEEYHRARKNPAQWAKRSAARKQCGKALVARRKQTVINAYGGRCACCGESTLDFLTVDHLNGDGAAHRKSLREQGKVFYDWLVKNNFPSGFQILCYNCNSSKGTGDMCYHQKVLAVHPDQLKLFT